MQDCEQMLWCRVLDVIPQAPDQHEHKIVDMVKDEGHLHFCGLPEPQILLVSHQVLPLSVQELEYPVDVLVDV